MKTYKIYIGANNDTGRLELAKAKGIIAKMFEGFTVYQAKGYWLGKPEKTAIIEICTSDKDKIDSLIKVLKVELKQDAIACNVLPALKFV
jgi:hypothetical protein